MKITSKILTLLSLTITSFFYSGCGSDAPAPDSTEKVQLSRLTKTWTLVSAELDGTDRTSDFANLKLTVSGQYASDGGTYAYSFTGTRPKNSPWPASGTWKFGANPEMNLTRLDDDPDLAMNYTVSDKQLDIKFNYSGTGFAGSRAAEIGGNWEFVFSN